MSDPIKSDSPVENQHATGSACVRRFIRILRVSAGVAILGGLATPVILAIIDTGILKTLILFGIALVFAVVFLGTLALGLWLIAGGKSQ